MVNLEIFPPFEWVGHDVDDLPEGTRRHFNLRLVGHHFYPEELKLWAYGTDLTFFCLCGETSGGLADRMAAHFTKKYGMVRGIGGRWI